MLSIIVASYRQNYFSNLCLNIKETIGEVEYEIIKVNNPGLMSVSKAYNEGAERAKFFLFLFIHEDVEFFTHNWGRELLKSFEEKNVGVIGLAGGTKKSFLPTGHDQGIAKYRNIFVIHKKDEHEIRNNRIELIKIKTLDGVFLAMDKLIWKEFKFNEEIDCFHFYDLDITLRISEKYQNYVNPNISLLHFSKGNFDNDWIKACLKFHKFVYPFDQYEQEENKKLRVFWYKRLKLEDISFRNRLNFFFKMGLDFDSLGAALRFISKR